ncbi:hypothetical protein V5F79_22415 [Xanthobacter flavus]|uniref:hypothetical protein n=1 Tax=Xanthobacter flavus TaxID=281 RepID=UPI003727E1FB
MPSEMQERIAWAIYESRTGNGASDGHWENRVKAFREMVEMFPDLPIGGDAVSDAFRDALAVMKAMREPTEAMAGAATPFADDDGPALVWKTMLDAEISLAEGGSDDRD